jgi:hypothetical protein
MTNFCTKDLLNEWVAKGVTSEFHDFIDDGAIDRSSPQILRFAKFFALLLLSCYCLLDPAGVISIRLTDLAGVCGVSSKKSEKLSSKSDANFAGAKLKNFLAKNCNLH